MIKMVPLKVVSCRSPETLQFEMKSAGFICIYDQRYRTGGALIVPEASYRQSKALVTELISQVRGSQTASLSSLEIKVIGTGIVVDSFRRTLADAKLSIRSSQILEPQAQVSGSFQTDTGGLKIEPVGERSVDKSQTQKTKVLIVDDSKVLRDVLKHVFKLDPLLEVVGEAETPSQVERLITQLKPDVITLDINMPEMDGVTLLTKIIPKFPIPVVMLSSISMEEGDRVFRALELGAVDYIQKPSFAELDEVGPQIAERVRLAASVKVKKPEPIKTSTKREIDRNIKQSTLIAIGASTGGPEALRSILLQMPPNIPPILVAQHIPPVFSSVLAKRLNELCAFEVKEAQDFDLVRPGRVLIAPGGFHMKLSGTHGNLKVRLENSAPVNRFKPSVDVLFNSLIDCGMSKSTIGIILTGMGNDGSNGLLQLFQKGARTIVQDEASSIVYGMPKQAVLKGGAESVLHLDKIPDALLRLLRN